ncbi:hypothetical protein H6G33_22700 [Calothrix sp. FACHB-1219]|uniref:hypothetical protein n=1 Tax=unclassified Calothrix TaxID=2619626 RepID=UPI001681DC9E|nr:MULTISPECIES: hypothetical protein [unclassified Calothrix]MBD2205025.1 hypothetical protein [Calothrix sp. FACHB-168]MBD2219823.1 hypothetical protein [Calothrix sp. FACHB-1219]
MKLITNYQRVAFPKGVAVGIAVFSLGVFFPSQVAQTLEAIAQNPQSFYTGNMRASHFFNQYPRRVLLHKQSLPPQASSL